MMPGAVPQSLTDYYLSYPTNNGFYDNGRAAVLGRMNGPTVSLVGWNFASGETFEIVEIPFAGDVARTGFVLFEVAAESDVLVYRADQRLWRVDLQRPRDSECVYAAPAGQRIEGLHSLSPAGDDLYFVLRPAADVWTLMHLDLSKRQVKPLISRKDWCIGHVQVSPFDSAWVGFCHDNQLDVPDRVCAWHAEDAATGICLYEQDAAEGLTYFCHERWRADRLGTLVVAYGDSPVGMPGLYEMDLDNYGPRLVCALDNLWHCNVSADGKWAIADTMPAAASGICSSDIVLIELETGAVHTAGTVKADMASQLTHPHPRFTPDGSRVLFQEAHESGISTVETIQL